MNMMTACHGWLPFDGQIAQRSLNRCVDFTLIEGPYPFYISTVTGMFVKAEYDVTDENLHKLCFDLKSWMKNSNDQEKAQLKMVKR